jgi:hypothetical protein
MYAVDRDRDRHDSFAGTSSTSVMNCMSRWSAVMPPSTFSAADRTPEWAFIASTTSRVCHPAASSTGHWSPNFN